MKTKTGKTTRLADKYIQKIFAHPNRPIKITDHSNSTYDNMALMRLIMNRVNTEHNILLHKDPIHRTLMLKDDKHVEPEWKETLLAFKDMIVAICKWAIRRCSLNNVLRVLALLTLIKILLTF